MKGAKAHRTSKCTGGLCFQTLVALKNKAKHSWVSDNTSEGSLCTRHPQLVPEFRLLCEKAKPPLWFTGCPGREHPQREISKESYTLNSLSNNFANWLWLEVSPVHILLLQTPQCFYGRMVFGHHLCLFSRKSEDWSTFWGHADRLLHFSGQIHIPAYVLAKRTLCRGSACSQVRNLQTHLPIEIWFGPGIEASSKKNLKMSSCLLWFSHKNIIFLFLQEEETTWHLLVVVVFSGNLQVKQGIYERTFILELILWGTHYYSGSI